MRNKSIFLKLQRFISFKFTLSQIIYYIPHCKNTTEEKKKNEINKLKEHKLQNKNKMAAINNK